MTSPATRAARDMTNRAFGEPATHLRARNGGPACGQVALGGRTWARTRYTTEPDRVTCKKCRRVIDQAGTE